MSIKDFVRKCLIKLKFDLNNSVKYDRLTCEIISKYVNHNSVCVDVGCHKGEILKLFLKFSPKRHYAFEPIPFMYEQLKHDFGNRCNISDIALSDSTGETTFNFVKNAPAFSGIKQRDYNTDKPDISIINVKLDKLDNIIPINEKIDFIKIDVEGAEMSVLNGAENIISRWQPYVLFEFGKGASNYYGTDTQEIYSYFMTKKMNISLLENHLKQMPPLTFEQFNEHYEDNSEYYFFAHK